MSRKLQDAGHRARGSRRMNGRILWQMISEYVQGVTREPPQMTSEPRTGEGRAAQNRQRKREVEEADRVVIAPRATAGKLRRFRAALVGSLQDFPKRRRPRELFRRQTTGSGPDLFALGLSYLLLYSLSIA